MSHFSLARGGGPTPGFTAAQIPGISGRRYPPSLAGPLYPNGIPIVAETELDQLCVTSQIDEVVFAYSDVTHEHVMHIASRVLATGADFSLLGPKCTTLPCNLPVIAVTAVRTGCGKSAVARWLSHRLRKNGKRVAVLRHPMPYGDLECQRVQRFASFADLDAGRCTIEEREEYEPHIAAGHIVFAGVDYGEILRAAEQEAELIVWDGGNNDFPFIKPNLHITVVDALRPRQITTHHPGEAVARLADVFILNKVDSAEAADVQAAIETLRQINPTAPIVRAASPVRLDDPAAMKGRRGLVIEDGPTITHGGMAFGAGYVAAKAAGVREIVDPRKSAAPAIRDVFDTYPHIGLVLPAVGYSQPQMQALENSINASDAEVVISATPIDLGRLLSLKKPVIRARYEFAEVGEPTLSAILADFLNRSKASRATTDAP